MRSRLILATLALGGVLPAGLAAQGGAPAPEADPLCRCFVGDDSTGARSPSGRGWTLLGAAGLALLAGIPVGSGGVAAGIPFVEGPPPPPGAPLGEIAAAAPTTAAPNAPADGRPAVPAPGAPFSMAPIPVPVPEQAGLLPPKTATHLPLLAAVGVLLMAGGGLLARRQARQQRRRRRRFVAL